MNIQILLAPVYLAILRLESDGEQLLMNYLEFISYRRNKLGSLFNMAFFGVNVSRGTELFKLTQEFPHYKQEH